MTTYNTGNPIGSTDARDLYDNAQNLDNFANGAAANYSDRLGVIRRSLAGIEATADGVLNGIGYSVPVAYASGISITLTSQTVEYNGVVYAPKLSALPFTTSSWGTDSAKFRAVQVTDSDLITHTPAGTGAVATTVREVLRRTVSVKDFGAVGDYNPATGAGTNDYPAFASTQSATSGVFEVPAGNYLSGDGGALRAYKGDGLIYNSSGINQKYVRVGNVGGNPENNHFSIGCIPRCAAGVFSLLDDATHDPMNVLSVTQPDAYSIRVNYSKTASKINSFIAAPDDALAAFGVVFGGDVGTSYANILAYAPFSFYCDHNTPTPYIITNALWSPSVSSGAITITKPDGATVRVTHPAAVTNDAVVATVVNGNALLTPVVSFGASQIDIIMHSDAQGYVSYNGSTWSQAFSDNLNSPTFTWTASNTLRVDHGVSGSVNKGPIVTGHGGAYIPQILNIGSTYFEVAFYDYAGAQVTAQSAGMKFWYRKDLLVPTTWPNSMIVSVMRGLCKVPSANFSNVAGNNIWVTGDMEV